MIMLKADTLPIARNGVRLNALLTNTGQVMPVSRQDLPPWLLAATDHITASNGGRFCSPLGDCELKISRTCGGGLLRVEQGPQSVGLAILAWQATLEHFLWCELLRARIQSLGGNGAPGLLRPRLPWLGVVLWPDFLRHADVQTLCRAESTFWAAAHSLLWHQGSQPPRSLLK